jgi:hypothetical protein
VPNSIVEDIKTHESQVNVIRIIYIMEQICGVEGWGDISCCPLTLKPVPQRAIAQFDWLSRSRCVLATYQNGFRPGRRQTTAHHAASWYQIFSQRGDFETVRAFAAKTLPRPVIHLDLVKDNRFVVICSAGTAP